MVEPKLPEGVLFTGILLGRVAGLLYLFNVNGDPKEKNIDLADGSREADPLRNANVGDLKTRLKYALSQLSPEHREVVQLCDIAGMNYSEVAAMLKIPEGTLRSRLHYAHRYMQSLLKDEL